MAIPSLPVTVPGSRPPTESLQGIRETALLEHAPVSKRSSSFVFSDGNRAWQRAAKDMRMRSKSVSHQNKEWTKSVRSAKRTLLAGTQMIDRAWQSVKLFIDTNVPRKAKHGEHAQESPLIRDLVAQHMWRQSLGTLPPNELLQRLGEAFRSSQ